jgi:hypothetical protein
MTSRLTFAEPIGLTRMLSVFKIPREDKRPSSLESISHQCQQT